MQLLEHKYITHSQYKGFRAHVNAYQWEMALLHWWSLKVGDQSILLEEPLANSGRTLVWKVGFRAMSISKWWI